MMYRLFFLAFTAWTLAACAPSAPVPESVSGPAYPVTLTHKYGSTTLTQAPVRIVTVGLVDQDAFVALGVVPVATREWYGKVPGALFPWAKAKIGEAPLPEVLSYELDFEKIAALKPDVIVGLYSGLTQEEYDTLSKIAPTVAQPDQPDWSADWRTITATVGTIVGRPEEAQAQIAGLEAKMAEVRQAHPEFATRTAILLSDYGWPATFFAYSYHGGLLRLLTDLGFQPVAAIVEQTGEKTGIALSRERFNLIDADLVLWTIRGAEGEKLLEADSVYSGLRAVKEGRAIYYRAGTGTPYDAMVFASVLSLSSVIDGLAADWAVVSDGNPSTKPTSQENS